MSILLAFASVDNVALCADCQHTNMRTGVPEDIQLKKIEKLSEKLYIAHCGSVFMTAQSMRVIQELYQQGTIIQNSVENVAEYLKCTYSQLLAKYPDVEEKCTSKFVVAGKLNNGHPGFIIVERCNNEIVTQAYDGTDNPPVKVFSPVDVKGSICVNIVDELSNKFLYSSKTIPEYIETVLRSSVKEVSLLSKYVSSESQFCILSKDEAETTTV